MPQAGARIGIDIGALYLKALKLDEAGQIVASTYLRHRGEIESACNAALDLVGVAAGDSLGITGSAAAGVARAFERPLVDHTRCQIAGTLDRVAGVTEILDIGGGSCTLIELDAHGAFQGHTTNSLCAAGTGSFLDEQAARLGISYEEMERFGDVEDPPTIAARCSVFAKSDLINRQQEGFSAAATWSGLCRGMTRTLLGTLLNGRKLTGNTAVIGGVALNRAVLRWLKERLTELLVVPEQPHLVAARGAALLGSAVEAPLKVALAARPKSAAQMHPWPLTLVRSRSPDFSCVESFVDEQGSEVRILDRPAAGVVPVFLGLDIGSTSTKGVLVDSEDRVVVDVYRKTAGAPVQATKLLFKALRQVAERLHVTWEIRGAGTTGSGRALIGEIIGADVIINEISAHVAGAVRVDPAVETIFEIGGQDSKYMHVVDGHIRDANMNYVCAAGTGSFVEEQALKLGYPVAEVGGAVLGQTPPRASDRCTVFMEQDVAALLQAGASREQALAAVMVAVVKNYLNKVVGNRPRSRSRISFQGATARNLALVAAFERLLDVEMVVSPYCHVMGSYGVALLCRRTMEERKNVASTFRGLDLETRRTTIYKQPCRLCQNDCSITFADIEGVSPAPSWGYMCGREPEATRKRLSPHLRYLTLRERLWREAGSEVSVAEKAPVVGIPRALAHHTFAPMWRRFFGELGFRVRMSPATSEEIRELGSRLAGGEFCFPAKVALGHVGWLATREQVDFLFVPQLGNERTRPGVNASTYCPYVQGWPAYSKSALALSGIPIDRLLAPLIDKRLPDEALARQLASSLGKSLERSPAQIATAWRRACESQEALEQQLLAAGERALREAKEKGERLLVLVGRPYNMADSGLNLDLPLKIAERGATVLPMDLLRPDYSRLGERYRNVYWAYGQKILAVLEQIATDDSLDAVYFTNFGCGPDSFLLSYAEEIMGKRPFLALELDDHRGDAGYLTRIEAYLDVLRRPRSAPMPRRPRKIEPVDLRQRTLWIPPLHTFGSDLFAAAFRRHGYDARPLPPETAATFELGRSLTRGSECLPTALTIGTFIDTLRRLERRDGQALFMPTACGPCRFGQYCNLHRQILDREGFSDVVILSPSSVNAYQGVDDALRRTLFKAMVLSDILLKASAKVRPYECVRGTTAAVLSEEIKRLVKAIVEGQSLLFAIRNTVARLDAIPRRLGRKPLVGIVGEIYVRNNSFSNENLIATIEELGGEVWPAPMAEWIMFLASPKNFTQHLERRASLKAAASYLTYFWQRAWNELLYRAAGPLLADRREPEIEEVLDAASFYMERNIGGEAMSIVGRTMYFARQGAALVVNCAPFGCMPGTITTALFRHVAASCHLPIVNMFYDGLGNQNRRLAVFLNNAVASTRGPAGA